MKIGLGSGTTVYYMLDKLGQLVRDGLKVTGIPSSLKTEALAKQFSVPLTSFAETLHYDLMIDGTKEIDPSFCMIKGGGGSFFREKLIALASDQVIIISERHKLVNQLGAFPVPVEILPFAWQFTARLLEQLGCKVTLRQQGDKAVQSDNGNYIADCAFAFFNDPIKLDLELKLIPGVLETGLFGGIADLLITMDAEALVVTHSPCILG